MDFSKISQITILSQKNHIFSNFREREPGAPPPLNPALGTYFKITLRVSLVE
jgi:hypothetical protein